MITAVCCWQAVSESDKKPLAVMNAREIVPVAVSISYRKGTQGRKREEDESGQ